MAAHCCRDVALKLLQNIRLVYNRKIFTIATEFKKAHIQRKQMAAKIWNVHSEAVAALISKTVAFEMLSQAHPNFLLFGCGYYS